MKFCLINPPHSYLVHPLAQASLALLYLATAASAVGHDVEIVNTGSLQVPIQYPAADMYGITATSLDYALDVTKIAVALKVQHPEGKIVLGGPVSLDPTQVDFKLVDTLVVGDGEDAICNLLQELECSNPLPRIYTGTQVDITNGLPLRRDLWPGQLGGTIFANRKDYYPNGSVTIMSSRGCPHKCAFCANPRISGRRIRYRPIDSVISEMEQVVTDFGIRQFRFSDETINAKENRVGKFCDAVRKSPILSKGIAWKASSRSRPNSREMYRDMASAGCKELSVGVESADPHVLEVLNKHASIEDSMTALRNMRRAGIVSRALFMAGTPGESSSTLRHNLRFFLDAEYDLISLTVFVPFPGCDIWEHPEAYDCEIVNRDLSTYNLYYYDSNGVRDVKPYVRLKNFDYDEMAHNVNLMRGIVQGLGKLNRG